MMTKAKVSGNYVGSILAKTESHRLGFDEAIMLGPDGYVAECTGENLFIARGGKVYTIPRAGILEGITRETVITLARDLGYEVIEEPISRDQLYISDEVFVCGTAAEVIALREIDFRMIGNGKAGPVTRALQDAFDELTTGRHPRSSKWLSHGAGLRRRWHESIGLRNFMGMLRAAVIGAGFVGRAHIESLRRQGIPVIGVLGSSRDRAAESARALRIDRVLLVPRRAC